MLVPITVAQEVPPVCRPTTCRSCSKTTWAGCGQHVDQVMRGVPTDQRCACSPAERTSGGFLSRVLGGR